LLSPMASHSNVHLMSGLFSVYQEFFSDHDATRKKNVEAIPCHKQSW